MTTNIDVMDAEEREGIERGWSSFAQWFSEAVETSAAELEGEGEEGAKKQAPAGTMGENVVEEPREPRSTQSSRYAARAASTADLIGEDNPATARTNEDGAPPRESALTTKGREGSVWT